MNVALFHFYTRYDTPNIDMINHTSSLQYQMTARSKSLNVLDNNQYNLFITLRYRKITILNTNLHQLQHGFGFIICKDDKNREL